MPKFYNFKNESDDQLTIDIDGVIGDPWWSGSENSKNTKEDVRDFLNKIGDTSVKNILVRISSSGGNVDDGLAIHDALKQHVASISVEVTGMTASAATIISQAADPGKLTMSDNALFLAHRAWTFAGGNARNFEAVAEDLKTIDSVIARIYSKRTGRSIEDINNLMDANNGVGKWITAEQAKEEGLIDDIFLSKEEPEGDNNNAKITDFQNRFAAMGVNIPVPDFSNSAIKTDKSEVNDMAEKTFSAAEIEAAKKEAVENALKHLSFIDKADNAKIIENIKEGRSFADCVEDYADQKVARALAAERAQDMKPENLDHHDAADEMDRVSEEEEKNDGGIDYRAGLSELGILRDGGKK